MTKFQFLVNLINIFSIIYLINAILQNLLYFVSLIISFNFLRKSNIPKGHDEAWWQYVDMTVPVSVIVPVYNEEAVVVEAVKSLLGLHYPNFEVIVINDGSTDSTLDLLKKEFRLKESYLPYDNKLPHEKIHNIFRSTKYNKLTVVNKQNGGKADAQNIGINVAKFPIFCIVDGDSILEADSLLRAASILSVDKDEVVAVGGSVRVANGSEINFGRLSKVRLPSNILPLFQIIEYYRSFLVLRLALSQLGATMLISGAFAIYRRSIIIELGGFSKDTVCEDMEIIIKMHKYLNESNREYKILFTPDPICWTEVPSDYHSLSNQRARWQQGALEIFFKYLKMLANPKYGVVGMIGYVYIFLADVMSPIIELIGLFTIPIFWYFGLLNTDIFLAYTAVTFILGIAFSIGSLLLSEMEIRRYKKTMELIILMFVSIIENFGYRQISNFWRIKGWYKFLFRKKHWGNIKRKGHGKNKK